MRRFMPMFLVATLAACGGASPTAPTPPAVPGPAPSPTPTPASVPPTTLPAPSPSPSPSGPTVLLTARMRGANGHNASGTVRVVRLGAGYTLEFLGDFRIDGGSNDIYLARSATVNMSRDLLVASLRSRTGAQSYALPGDGQGYPFVILWCRPFQIPIGVGELQ